MIYLEKLLNELQEHHEVVGLPITPNEYMINIDDQFEICLYHDEEMNFDSMHIGDEIDEVFYELNMFNGNLFVLDSLCDFMLGRMI